MLNYIFTHREQRKVKEKKTLQPKSERCIIKVRKLEDIVKEGHINSKLMKHPQKSSQTIPGYSK